MTPRQQEAYDLRTQGMTRKQIADHMNISDSAVKHLLARAKVWLNADPAAREAATIAGSQSIPHSFWKKTDTHSIYYKTPVDDTKADVLSDIADAFQNVPAYRPNPVAPIGNDLMTVYPLYDMHIGMLAWARETRGQDYDLDLAKQDLVQSIKIVSDRSPNADKALIILGGDTIHVNDHFNETPASKHHQDADGRFEKIVDVAIEAIAHVIEVLAENHSEVSVVILRGNHDETSHIVLKAAFKQRYRLCERIKFPSIDKFDKSEIYWHRHGRSLIAAHHGDKIPPQRLAMIVADICPFWSDTRHRTILTGHRHTMQVQDFPGVTHYSLRAFCPPDAYGSMFGGVRGLSAMTYCAKSGIVNVASDPIERD